jgi:hypothetical protein
MTDLRGLRLLFFLVIIFVSGSCRTDTGTSGKKLIGFTALKKHFQSPATEYSTAPFMVWNDRVSKEKIDSMLTYFVGQDIYQVFIHPRPGMITEYLSDEWFELCKYTVDKGKELNMNVWLYDENSYPSGFAGGHVPAAMPKSYNQGVGLKLHKLKTLDPANLKEYDLILTRVGNAFADITHGADKYVGKAGEFYAFSKWYYNKAGWTGGYSYVDLLYPGVTEKFIDITMKGYEKRLGDEFGKHVPGIFTDEPNINPGGSDVIKWTPDLFRVFKERYRYDQEVHLPSLYEQIGDWKNVRHDYYQLLLELFIDRWSKPWYAYTESNGLKWTGHYWEHGWPSPKHGPDNMAMYAWHQVPAIDMLFNNEELRPDQFGNNRAVKELSSVVNQMGKERALSETYGGGGWDLSFNDMKRLGDWEYVLGVNFMNQHLSHMTLRGSRKGDYPQSFSYHTPWWPKYHILADYFARLSYVLSQGEQVNKILVLEPTTSAWMLYNPGMSNSDLAAGGIVERYKKPFDALIAELEKRQVEYDLGCENIIKDQGRVEGAALIIGERTYDLVVLPGNFDNIEKPTLELVGQYLENGGKVLALGPAPKYVEGNETDEAINLAIKYADQWMTAGELSDPGVMDLLKSEGFSVQDPLSYGGRVFHQRRQFADGQLLFWTNFDQEDPARIRMVVQGKDLALLNPLNGEIAGYSFKKSDEGMDVSFTLPPSGSMLLFAAGHALHLQPDKSPDVENPEKVVSSPGKIRRLQPNMITLDYCDLKVRGKQFKDMYFYAAQDTVYKFHLKKKYGRRWNPWNMTVQYRGNVVALDNFPDNSGFKASYPFFIKSGFMPSDVRAVIELTKLYTIKINGKKVEPASGEWWLDRDFGVVHLDGFIREGRNELTIEAHPMSIYAELEPAYLLGNFGVKPTTHGWMLVPPENLTIGSWKEQLMPFYSYQVSYERAFSSTEEGGSYRVRLRDWKGTVAAVRVNGKDAGVIGWPPYELDISPYVGKGENEVEVIVYGSLKNLLGPHHGQRLKGFVTPWEWLQGPLHQPPGSDYDLYDYGLFEDFEILTGS